MTQTEQAIQDLRDAIKAELIETAREWWNESKDSYLKDPDPEGAVDDLLITLEQA
jgi:hypothetical protein